MGDRWDMEELCSLYVSCSGETCTLFKLGMLDKGLYYPVDISTTVFSYSRAVQYHAILHGTGVIARVLLHGCYCTGVIARALGLRGILATTMCFNYNQ